MSGPATPAGLEGVPCASCGSTRSTRWARDGVVSCLSTAGCSARIRTSRPGRPGDPAAATARLEGDPPRRWATVCPRCGVLPGLHRPDGACPLTRKLLHGSRARV